MSSIKLLERSTARREKTEDLKNQLQQLIKDDAIDIEELQRYFVPSSAVGHEKPQIAAGPAAKKLGNPAVVGLAGFGLTTMILQFHNIGWMQDMGPVVCLGIIFGGLAQMIAGLQEFKSGNNFGYSAFTSFGCFWIALALLLLAKQLKIYTPNDQEVGMFLLVFTIYTAIMWIGSWKANFALAIVFTLLLLGFILLDIGHFCKDAKSANVAAGYVLLVCASGALYIMAHLIYLDTYKHNILPVGPAPVDFFMERAKRRHAAGYDAANQI